MFPLLLYVLHVLHGISGSSLDQYATPQQQRREVSGSSTKQPWILLYHLGSLDDGGIVNCQHLLWYRRGQQSSKSNTHTE